MLLQVALYGVEFVRAGRAKPCLVIDKDDPRILEMHDHVWEMIAVHIDKTERHRHQVLAIPEQLWPQVDAGLRCIAAGKLDDLDAPIQIERNEVARIVRRVVMAHDSIGLKSSGTPIMQIIPGRIPPADSRGERQPQREHG